MDVAPRCSSEQCKSFGWVKKVKRKPNQMKVAQQESARKRARVEKATGVQRPDPVRASLVNSRRRH